MKKQVALALAAALSLSVAGTALAAPANPFVDVPANHWAYDALAQLQKGGVVTGYGDGTFRGDRNLTRYEMAAMIAKITIVDDKNGPIIKRLQSEFATELYNLGVRVDKLEKGASSIKFSGNARIRYHAGMSYPGGTRPDYANGNSSAFYERINLNLSAKVNDNVEFMGTLRAQNNINSYKQGFPAANENNKTSSTGSLWFHRAEFKMTKNKFTASLGRINPTLGQGLIWDGEPIDGILAAYDFGRANLAVGYGDLFAAYNSVGPSLNVFVANLDVKVTDRINFTAAYLDALNPQDSIAALGNPGYAFKQWAVGGNIKLGSDFKLIGEYVENADAPDGAGKKGAWGRVQWKEIDNKKPGTYSAYAEYMKLGNWAIDSYSYCHTLDVAGGNGIGGDGAKGWGVGFQYVPAKNVNMGVTYHDMKPMSSNNFDKYKKSYMFTTNFLF